MPRAVGRKLTRRQAIVGTAMLVGAAALPDNVAANALPSAHLLELGSELDRLRRRCARLRRQVRRLAVEAESIVSASSVPPDYSQQLTEMGYDLAWQAWSTTIERSLELAGRIRSLPADDLAGWAVKYRALVWELFEHEGSPSVSEHQLRLLRRLGSELQRIHP